MNCGEDSNCGYWYRLDNETRPRCHYHDPWPAPCEHEEEETDEV